MKCTLFKLLAVVCLFPKHNISLDFLFKGFVVVVDLLEYCSSSNFCMHRIWVEVKDSNFIKCSFGKGTYLSLACPVLQSDQDSCNQRLAKALSTY